MPGALAPGPTGRLLGKVSLRETFSLLLIYLIIEFAQKHTRFKPTLPSVTKKLAE
jgi:hypothetical protein